jgi:copper transport protein
VDGTTATLVALPGTIGTAPAPKSLRRLMATPTAPARRRLPPLDLQDPSVILVRWLNFAAIMMVIGVVGFRVLVVPRLTPRGTVNDLAPFSDRTIERAAGLGLTAAAIALVASVSRLYAQQAVVGHGAYMETILNSFWGHIWLFQLATAIVACVAFAMARLAIGDDHRKFAWIAATVAALLLSASPALSGHAIAAPKHRSISVALDIIHVIAAGAWLGGLFAVTIAGIPAAVAVGGSGEAPRSSTLIAALVNAFRPVALVSATMVMASGAVGGWLRLGSLGALIHSGYGRALLIKLGFVALVLAGGAFNWLRMRGTLSQRDAAAPAVAAFRRSAWLELSAGILVIVATAVLVAARPPIR